MKHKTFAGLAGVSRRKVRTLVLIVAALFGTIQLRAQSQGGKQSYNYTRALEEIQNGNNATALEFLTKEVNEHPDNGYARLRIAMLQAEAENYGTAMAEINKALKKLPKNDREIMADALGTRAQLYAASGDSVKALDDFSQAVKLCPDNEDVLNAYGQILYEMKRFSESDDIFRRLAVVNPASARGYMGLGRNACHEGNYDEAVRQYDTVLKMYDEYTAGYSFRGEAYLKQGKYAEAADDFLKAMAIGGDNKAFFSLFKFPANQTKLVATKLQAMAVRYPLGAEWPYSLGELYLSQDMYSEAIEAFRKAADIDQHPVFFQEIARCYDELGEYPQAIQAINQAVQMSPDDMDYLTVKADLLGESGDIDGAIGSWTKVIEMMPDLSIAYYRRGFYEDNSAQTDKALEDYEMAAMLNPDYAYAFLGKGDMLLRKGQRDEAMEAFRKVVELDTVPSNASCAMYALLALGEKEKAEDFMQRVIANDTTYSGNYYDGACFYARLGLLDKSLDYLRTAFEKGFRRFHHVTVDDDLDPLRTTDAYRALMDKYARTPEPAPDAPDATDTTAAPPATAATASAVDRVEVPFTPEGGCVSVKCSINDLPLSFIFDTGASTVSLSQVEANFMLKNGYLKPDDIVGSGHFVDANGDISEGTIVNIREVDFGGLKLNNVRASVVRNQKAPLLLGQTVLGRLGSIQIDNPAKKLIITPSN